MWDEWEWLLWDDEDIDFGWDYDLFEDEIKAELEMEIPF